MTALYVIFGIAIGFLVLITFGFQIIALALLGDKLKPLDEQQRGKCRQAVREGKNRSMMCKVYIKKGKCPHLPCEVIEK